MSAQKAIPYLLSENQKTNEDWFSLVSYFTNSFSEHLNQKIEIVELKIVDREAFCCSIRSADVLGGPLELSWEGLLGMDLIEGQPHVSATLFLFSNDRRLSLSEQPGSYLEFVYRSSSDQKPGGWQPLGWLEDEFGEYAGVSSSRR